MRSWSTLLVADGSGQYFKGSGTSEAAAVEFGAVALLLQQRPRLTPDQVKLPTCPSRPVGRLHCVHCRRQDVMSATSSAIRITRA